MIRTSCIRGLKSRRAVCGDIYRDHCAYALYARNVTFLKIMPFSYCNFYCGQVQ